MLVLNLYGVVLKLLILILNKSLNENKLNHYIQAMRLQEIYRKDTGALLVLSFYRKRKKMNYLV